MSAVPPIFRSIGLYKYPQVANVTPRWFKTMGQFGLAPKLPKRPVPIGMDEQLEKTFTMKPIWYLPSAGLAFLGGFHMATRFAKEWKISLGLMDSYFYSGH